MSLTKIPNKMTNFSDGWIPLANYSFSYASDDSPTFTMSTIGDLTSTLSVGQKISLQQSQALTSYWALSANLNDTVGANNGSAIGSPTYTSGKFGTNSLTLNGSNQAVSLGDITGASVLKPTGDFTIRGWVKLSGARQFLFISYSQNINPAGFYIEVAASGVINFCTGKNTGDYTQISGKTTVLDNLWHYICITFKDNWGQIYIDGSLDGNGYLLTPAYAATTYVRLGCFNQSGNNFLYATGQFQDWNFINGQALSEQEIRRQYLSGITQGTGALTLTKHFILTLNPSYSAGTTTLTMYGGTDFSLSNLAISNVYYSREKIPFGFNSNNDKWSVIVIDAGEKYKNNATLQTFFGGANGWDSGTNISITIPVGVWDVSVTGTAIIQHSSANDAYICLSTSNSSKSDNDLAQYMYVYSEIVTVNRVILRKIINLSVKTPYYYLVGFTAYTSTQLKIGAGAPTIIKAVCAYL